MMKQLQLLIIGLIISGFMYLDAFAQQEVTIRELNTYEFPLESQDDLPNHPLVGVPVSFDAVVVSYPRSSGLANITAAGVPGRIHVFVADVNAIEDGLDGNSMQIVVAGALRETLEGLGRGDVINVVGELTFFGNVGQFNATDINFLGSANEPGEFEDLLPLLEPTVISMDELNIPADTEGLFQWNAENYTKYIFRYVRIEGAEVIDRLEADNGRPWMIASQGNSVMVSNDTSLRYRNDRNNYAFDPETGNGLNYNYRRPAVDGPFVPPATGSLVNWSGFPVVNTFNPGGTDVAGNQSTLKLAYFEDGFVWVADGDDPANRFAPEGWPNDLVVVGFPPVFENFTLTPEGNINGGDDVSLSIDITLAEEDYSFESVTIEYNTLNYTEDEPTTFDGVLDQSGNNFTFDFGSFGDFTSVDFTIIAQITTGDGTPITGTFSESFFVGNEDLTSPVLFSPASGEFTDFVQVSLSSPTEEATIYYTIDGSEPTEESLVYGSPLVLTETTTVRAIATSSGLGNSPVNERTYVVANENLVDVSTIGELREGLNDGTLYRLTGDAVVTFTRATRNQKYIQDETGGVLIDDAAGRVTEFYATGDVMTNVIGTLSVFQGVIQFTPQANPGAPTGNEDVMPVDVTLADIDLDVHESVLVRVTDVNFGGVAGTFSVNTNYDILDPSLDDGESRVFRTIFNENEVNYIGMPIPSGNITLTALVSQFNGTIQLTARSGADLGMDVSTRDDEIPSGFELSQNYPNPFNPTTNIRYTLPEAADVTLTVYDVLGRRVALLVNQQQTAGQHTVSFDASRLASGTYIYRIQAGNFTSTKKMMLIK
ncbi:MAG: chitobiase/beta-hexosaminidase C-terminal domain-containing protein [Balneolia bacterium]|nr:chitobiase/beta-hexosaminidase C-terminal domain-containing protein [Balneolia bacterium]